MNVAKAPVGGIASRINGRFYNGGEFMPVHGLFCGVKGAKRRAKWDRAAASSRAKDLGGDTMFEVSEYCGNGVWSIVGYAIASDAKAAVGAFVSRGKLYAKQA